MNNKLYLVLAVSLCAVSVEQPTNALNMQPLATIISSKVASIAKYAGSLMQHQTVQSAAPLLGFGALMCLLGRSLRNQLTGGLMATLHNPSSADAGSLIVTNLYGQVFLNDSHPVQEKWLMLRHTTA